MYVAVPAPASGDVLFVDAAEGGMLRGRVCLRDGRTHEIRELGLNEAEVVPFFIGADRVGFIEKDGAGERIAVRDLEGNAVSLRHELPRLAPPITRAP